MIREFKGRYLFLSNFYNNPVLYNGLVYENAEAAFHASKCIKLEDRFKFANLNPSEAKKLGRMIELRDDWEEVKDQIMYEIIKNKFRDCRLRQMLVDTGNEELQEGNWWYDTYWGVDIHTGKGLNKLGKILMKVREEILNGTY